MIWICWINKLGSLINVLWCYGQDILICPNSNYACSLTDSRSAVPGCFQWWVGGVQGAGSWQGEDSHRKGHERIRGRGATKTPGTWGIGSCRRVRVLTSCKFEEHQYCSFPCYFEIPHNICSLLQEMQKCFDEKDIQMLQEVISKMDPTVGSFLKTALCFHRSTGSMR